MATLIPTSRPGRLLWGLPWLRRTVAQAGTDWLRRTSQRRGIATQGYLQARATPSSAGRRQQHRRTQDRRGRLRIHARFRYDCNNPEGRLAWNVRPWLGVRFRTANGNRTVALSVKVNWVNARRGRPGQSKGQEAVFRECRFENVIQETRKPLNQFKQQLLIATGRYTIHD